MRAYETDRGELLIPHSFETADGAIADGWKLVDKGSAEALPWEWRSLPLPAPMVHVAERLREAKQAS